MLVEFRTHRKKGDQYVEQIDQKSPSDILQMQAMPAGYYRVSHDKIEDEKGNYGPESIIDIDPVVFMAICRFDGKPELITCYAIQVPQDYGLKWYPDDQVEIYAYDAYVEASVLANEPALPFIEWFKNTRRGQIPFDLSIEDSPEPAEAKSELSNTTASRPDGKQPMSL